MGTPALHGDAYNQATYDATFLLEKLSRKEASELSGLHPDTISRSASGEYPIAKRTGERLR